MHGIYIAQFSQRPISINRPRLHYSKLHNISVDTPFMLYERSKAALTYHSPSLKLTYRKENIQCTEIALVKEIHPKKAEIAEIKIKWDVVII